MRTFYKSLFAFNLLLWSAWICADEFVLEDIQVEGLQRISAGTVFNYLPVSIGTTLSPDDYPEIIRALFKTGFFTDVNLERNGNVLVISVVERPAIAEIEIKGNKDIATDQLKTALQEVGLTEGQVFNRSLLDQLEQELLRQYFSRGKYGVKVDTEVKPLPRNRVAIRIDISEGVAARISQINIVGNRDFDEDDLLDLFQLSPPGYFTLLTKGDQYSKQKLAADIETLRSFYLDRGYLKFNVNSTQVSITPDKKDIYITINITEGDRYTIQDVTIAGDMVVAEPELRQFITIQPGDTFSRGKLNEITQKMADRLGNEGYAFSNVNTVPDVNEVEKTVNLTFVIDPGKRVYVRRINFSGNVKTRDEVLRRELRQVEGAWFSTKDVNRSKVRLERLRYLREVQLETPAVPGTTDQVDVNIQVVEEPSGNLIFGLGFGQESGVLFNASVNQSNFLGTGNEVGLAFNNSDIDRVFSFSFNNPYFTLDGVSRGFEITYQEIDASAANTADYVIDNFSGQVNFGFPLNEFDTVFTGVGFDRKRIGTTLSTPIEIQAQLLDTGKKFLDFPLEASFSRDSRNRAIFPDKGALNRVSGEITLPGSDAKYYKLSLRHLSFFPLTRAFTLSFRGNLGYGGGYSSTDRLPFYENFFAGGLTTVRGFKSNTLGPRYINNQPSGGNLRLVGGAELIFPVPFLRDSNAFRIAAFADGGNVFDTKVDNFKYSEIRYSAGVVGRWLSPFGPLALSVAKPLNDKAEDETEVFQFSFGVPF